MVRSKWKGPFVSKNILKNRKNSLVFRRNSVILDDFVGVTVLVHKGKGYETVLIKEEMVGMQFGSFALTKKIGKLIHKKDLKKKRK